MPPVTVVMRDEDAGALSMDLIRERRGRQVLDAYGSPSESVILPDSAR